MSIFDIFQKPEDLNNLPKDPDGFVTALSKRKHWREIKPSILFDICREAGGDHGSLILFAYISEISGLVNNSFIPASNRSENGLPPRIAFSISLYLLGIRKLNEFYQESVLENKRCAQQMADLAFTASLLCDPFRIESYAYLANLYASFNREATLDFCEKYRNALDRLMRAPTESLSDFHRIIRMELESPEKCTQFFDSVSSMGGPSFDGHTATNVRKFVEDLDRAMRGLDLQNPRDEEVRALNKAINQMF